MMRKNTRSFTASARNSTSGGTPAGMMRSSAAVTASE